MPLETKTAPSGGIDLGGISNLASLFLGKDSSSNSNTNQSTTGGSTSTNSGGTTNSGTVTQSEYTSPEAVKAVVDSILQGTQGLAAVSSGQNKAGLYNSSTNRMLVNDLIARASAEGAKLNKTSTQSINTATADNRSTTATNTNNVATSVNGTATVAPQVSPVKAAGGLGVLQLLSMVGGKDKILNQIFGKKSTTGASTANAGANSPNAGGSNVAGNTSDSGGGTNLPSTANISSSASGVNNPSAYTSGGSDVGSNSQEVSGDISQSIQSTITPATDDLTGVFGNDFSSNNMDLSTAGTAGTISDTGADASNAVIDGGSQNINGVDFNSFDPSAAVDAIDPNFDFGGFSDNFGDFDLGFAEGGMVEKTKALLSVNPNAEAAFKSGGDEPAQGKQEDKKQESKQESAAKSDNTGKKSLGVKLFDYIRGYAAGGSVEFRDKDTYTSRGPLMLAEGGRVTPKAYARGGMVDLTNLGLRNRGNLPVTSPLSVTGGSDQVISSVADNFTPVTASGTGEAQSTQAPKIRPGDAGTKSANEGSLIANAGNKTPTIMAPKKRVSTDIPIPDQLQGAGPETSIPSVVGTPEQNAAAINGMATMGLNAVAPGLGTVVGLGMNALGLNVTSMNPISQLVSFLVGQVTSGDEGITQSDDAVGGMSAPSVTTQGVTTIGASTTQEAQDAANTNNISLGLTSNPNTTPDDTTPNTDAVDGIGISAGGDTGNDGGNDGVGGGGGPASSSAGDSSGPSYSSGGDVSGPGTPTSDSIPAYLSKDEFVLNAHAVKAIEDALGDGWLDEINDAFKPSNQELQKGKQVHQKQFGKRVA